MLLFLKLCYLSQKFPCLLITLRKFIYRYVSGIRLSWKNLLPILTIFEYFIKKLIRTTLFHFKCEFFKSFRAWLLQYVNLKVVTAVWMDHFQEFDEIWYSYSANPQSYHLSISIKKTVVWRVLQCSSKTYRWRYMEILTRMHCIWSRLFTALAFMW